ncbi:MAG: hypothetical protein U0931_14470 [Vulcanimicrobiota bacterium]
MNAYVCGQILAFSLSLETYQVRLPHSWVGGSGSRKLWLGLGNPLHPDRRSTTLVDLR